MVEVVTFLIKVLVEGYSCLTGHVVTMGIKAQVRRRLRFSDILVTGTLQTVPQVDRILAFAIKFVTKIVRDASLVAFEGFCCRYLTAAFVF